MAPVDTAAERDEKRSTVANEHAKTRDDIVQQYVKDKAELREVFEKDLLEHDKKLATAYNEVGLNPDGSDPRGRPMGSAS